MPFEVPRQFESFATQTVDNLRGLIRRGALEGLDSSTLNQWLANFQGAEERYLAAHILDALIYRSLPMMRSSFQHALEFTIPQALKRRSAFRHRALDDFLEALRSNDVDPGVRFVEMYGDSMPGVAKSGSAVLREFQRHTGTNLAWLLKLTDVSALGTDVDAVVLLDDFVGTGKQFSKVLAQIDANLHSRTVYVPLIAHERGIAHLARVCPTVTVAPVERIGAAHDFFAVCQGTDLWARDQINEIGAVKSFYRQVMKRRLAQPRAFGSMNATVAFALSTPNNSLAALHAQRGTWHRLFPR